jgi:twinkle protein
MTLSVIEHAAKITLSPTNDELRKYLHYQEANKIIPASAVADEAEKLFFSGKENIPGLRLPWEELDDKVRITPGTLAIWSGWSHHGKTQMLKQSMLAAIQQGQRVCIASMEEPVMGIYRDLLEMASFSRNPTRAAEFRNFCDGKLWFYDQQDVVPAEKMRAVIRYCVMEKKVTQFVVDSLMMINTKANDKFADQVDFVRDLKVLAKDTKTTIHLVAHNKKPQGKASEVDSGDIHMISGGFEIGAIADYVFSVWRNKKPRPERSPGDVDAKLTVEKQRGIYNWIGDFGLNFHTGSRQFVRGIEAMTFWDAPTHAEF